MTREESAFAGQKDISGTSIFICSTDRHNFTWLAVAAHKRQHALYITFPAHRKERRNSKIRERKVRTWSADDDLTVFIHLLSFFTGWPQTRRIFRKLPLCLMLCSRILENGCRWKSSATFKTFFLQAKVWIYSSFFIFNAHFLALQNMNVRDIPLICIKSALFIVWLSSMDRVQNSTSLFRIWYGRRDQLLFE